MGHMQTVSTQMTASVSTQMTASVSTQMTASFQGTCMHCLVFTKSILLLISKHLKEKQNRTRSLHIFSVRGSLNTSLIGGGGGGGRGVNAVIKPLENSVQSKIIFLISQSNNLLWVLKRTVSINPFFWAPKTNI